MKEVLSVFPDVSQETTELLANGHPLNKTFWMMVKQRLVTEREVYRYAHMSTPMLSDSVHVGYVCFWTWIKVLDKLDSDSFCTAISVHFINSDGSLSLEGLIFNGKNPSREKCEETFNRCWANRHNEVIKSVCW